MSLKMGGFVCDNCSIFKPYDNSFDPIRSLYRLPYGWLCFKNNKLISIKYIYNESDNNSITPPYKKYKILCDKCSNIHQRKIKIKKIKNGKR